MFLIIGFLLLASPIYWFFMRKFNYWKKRGINGPKPLPIFGNLLDILLKPRTDVELNYYRKYGNFYGYYLGNTPVLVVGEPELIKSILVKDFNVFMQRRGLNIPHPIMKKSIISMSGDDWKRIRSITSPTFTPSKMKLMYTIMEDCIKDFMVHLDDLARRKSNVNVKDIFENLALDVIASSAFATKLNSRNELDSLFVIHARQIFSCKPLRMILLKIIPKSLFAMVGANSQAESLNFYVNFVRQMLKNRKESVRKSNDFLQLLIDADHSISNDETDNSKSHHVNKGKEELEVEKEVLNVTFNSSNKKLDEDEVIAQAVSFMLGGYETMAAALTFATYELALNPDVQDKLCDEVNASLDANGRIDYDVLCRLPYLDAVISETLRRHSPSVKTNRIATQEYKVGKTGITIYPGQQIDIPIYAIHHDERYYKNPFKFDPERFMPQNIEHLVPYTYLPFGEGPRNCIGLRFALLEVKLTLAQIVRRYAFFECNETEVPLTPDLEALVNVPKRAIVGIGMRQ